MDCILESQRLSLDPFDRGPFRSEQRSIEVKVGLCWDSILDMDLDLDLDLDLGLDLDLDLNLDQDLNQEQN